MMGSLDKSTEILWRVGDFSRGSESCVECGTPYLTSSEGLELRFVSVATKLFWWRRQSKCQKQHQSTKSEWLARKSSKNVPAPYNFPNNTRVQGVVAVGAPHLIVTWNEICDESGDGGQSRLLLQFSYEAVPATLVEV